MVSRNAILDFMTKSRTVSSTRRSGARAAWVVLVVVVALVLLTAYGLGVPY